MELINVNFGVERVLLIEKYCDALALDIFLTKIRLDKLEKETKKNES